MTLQDALESMKGKRIAVLGIGISNEPLIRLLSMAGLDVTAMDSRTLEQFGEKALSLISGGVKLKLGKDYLEGLENYDLIFRTPGLMPFDEHLENAKLRGAEVTSEMELFCRLCPCKIIAVTGSDGKTTTTTIIAKLLEQAGYTVHLGGNIGKPLLCELPLMKTADFAVLELSSFQLHSMVCSPDIAVITNISPNHLDKHKDFQDYVDAKKQIFINQKKDSVLVTNADDPIVSAFPGTVQFSMKQEVNGCYYRDGAIYRSGHYLMDASQIRIPGEHNIANYCAAFASTIGLVEDEICVELAKTFSGVPHRLETIRTLHGVTYINDSIGSSPTRTIAGLKALKRKPVIILGGYDKKIPFDELGTAVRDYAKFAVLTGQTADKIAKAIDAAGCGNYRIVPDFEDAVKEASVLCEEGDIVLLSPACASFDRFSNFEQRGDYFRKLVWEMEE